MLIRQRLALRDDFSQVDCAIADYILRRGAALQGESARHIASAVYTSASSVVRLCQKLGFAGYSDFRDAWLAEGRYLSGHFQEIDANRPFAPGDPVTTIASKMAALYRETVDDTLVLQDPDMLVQAVNYCRRAGTIYVCSAGSQSGLAEAFGEKMAKIGKTVLAEARTDMNFFHACTCPVTDCFLLISYSGETANTLRVARKLRQRRVHTVAITSYGGNTLGKLFSCKLYLSTRERLVSNTGNFGAHLSTMYLLDLLYAGVFGLDFEGNYELKKQVSREFEIYRRSENPVLKESED